MAGTRILYEMWRRVAQVDASGRRVLDDRNWNLLRTRRPCHTLGNFGRSGCPAAGAHVLVFSAVALPPFIFADPKDHAAWGGNAYNLAAVAAAWILADSIARYQGKREGEAKTRL